MNTLYCIVIIIILFIFLLNTKEYFQQDFYFNYKHPEIVSLNLDTYPRYPYLSYFNKVKPAEILSTPIIWYNNKWFSSNFGLTSGAGYYALETDYGTKPGFIGQVASDCMNDVYV